MPYFKKTFAAKLKRPVTIKVILVQLTLALIFSIVFAFIDGYAGLSVLVGGLIAVAGQVFYNMRALRFFGSPNIGLILSSTSSAMRGKWLIIISATTASVVTIEELNTVVLYASVFGLHTLGALLLPILVKRAP